MSIDLGAKVLNGGNIPRASSGTSLPLTGINNELFLLTTTNTIYYWKAGAWVATAGGGGTGNVTTSGLLVNFIPKATTANNIESSSLKEIGSVLSYGGTLVSFPNKFSAGTIYGISSAASISPGVGLGPTGTAIISGNSTRGLITLNFDPVTVVDNTSVATVSFSTVYTSSPVILLTPATQYPFSGTSIGIESLFYIPQPTVSGNSFQIHCNIVRSIYEGYSMQLWYHVIG